MVRVKSKSNRPRLLIGSSTEGRRVANVIQGILLDEIDTVIWHEGVGELGAAPIEALDRAADESSFAALVITSGDVLAMKGERRTVARDNLLFEAGLFMGRLGRDRLFVVCPWDSGIHLPSNLLGLTMAHYPAESEDGLQVALGPASKRIREAIAQLKGAKPTQTLAPASLPFDPHSQFSRPRRCNSLGIALTHSQKDELRIVNISVSGALLETPGEIPVGKTLELDLRLDNGIVISVTACVVRVQQPDWQRTGGVGVAFTSVPEESARALKAFVELDSRAA